jgi:hypothetical protein
MRLLVEILIIAGLLYLGWDRPFKDWAAQGYAIATSKVPASLSAEKRLRKAP